MSILDNKSKQQYPVNWFTYQHPVVGEMIGCEPVSPSEDKPCKKIQKEIPMAYATAITVAAAPVDTAKDYLLQRVAQIAYGKHDELKDLFKDPQPKTIKEAKKWMKEGKFHFTGRYDEEQDDYDEDRSYLSSFNWHDCFHWGEKDRTEEEIAAETALRAAQTKAEDVIIVVSDDQTRLAALREFEEYKVQ